METSKLLGTSKTRETIALVVFTLFTIIPTMDYSGFFSEEGFVPDEKTLYLIAAIGSVLALFIGNHRRYIANLIGGPLIGVGVALCTVWYLSERDSIIKIELVIPLLLGALPGFLVYYFISKSTDKKVVDSEG